MQATISADLSDVESLAHHVREEWGGEALASERPWLARAAAPLDCMGGFAEYCGSLTLTLPMADGVCCAVQGRHDQRVSVSLRLDGQNGRPYAATLPLAAWYDGGRATNSATFRDRLEQAGEPWARPAFGVLHAMLASGTAPHLGGGLNIALATAMRWDNDGRSSAAAAAATAAAVSRCLGFEASALEMARWCQTSENQFLGLPCGFASSLCALQGEAGHLMQVRCQPAENPARLPLPDGIGLVGIDCGARHPGADRKYREARTAAFMGRRIIERLLATRGRSNDWGGWLARLSINDYVETLRDHLPTRMKGRDFSARFGPLDDPLCLVEDDGVYKIRSRTEHHIYENSRVHQFAERLARAQRTGERGALLEASELMFASHWSYGQRCGLGSIETDRLVNLLRQRGPGLGIFGAKVCGCGAGGTVAVLLSDTDSARAAVEECAAEYSACTGRTTRISRGTSDGALVYGVRQAG